MYKILTRSCLSTLNPVDSIVHITIQHADNLHEVYRRQTQFSGDVLEMTHTYVWCTDCFSQWFCKGLNSLKHRGVGWLHFEVFSAVQV